ncbi:16S rRNA (uracil(1498)-N(3))-methyltransferase [Ectothiorhodospiraceae bacterium WFHF3C12]|nr:16S rRNA (uracil(1498)-N(3))-methyltransferase [Ectothiorhodospiraceae bacterium WFHF3C12]
MQLEADPELLAHLKARRARAGEMVMLFNGHGGQYEARVETLQKRSATLSVLDHIPGEAESPLRVTLLQGVSKGERMDFAVQKAVELGVAAIVPVITRHTVVRLDAERGAKRQAHWRKVAISACEQCGRNTIPGIHPPVDLREAIAHPLDGAGLLLAAEGETRLRDALGETGHVTLLVGPEGGLHPEEEDQARAAGFTPVALGPRVLRTETAAVAALAALQVLRGDID